MSVVPRSWRRRFAPRAVALTPLDAVPLPLLGCVTDLRLADERILDVEERWLSGSQRHQDWPDGNSHQVQLIPEVWVCDPRHPPTAFCIALSVNIDSRLGCMNLHTVDKAVDLDIV